MKNNLSRYFRFSLFSILLALAGCAGNLGTVFGTSPEAQIVNGANAVTTATTLATVLLKNNKITVVQAKSYSAILHAGRDHLGDADKRLTDCRAKTASTSKTNPDPCAATVADDIALGISVVADVQKLLKAKE